MGQRDERAEGIDLAAPCSGGGRGHIMVKEGRKGESRGGGGGRRLLQLEIRKGIDNAVSLPHSQNRKWWREY